jgi:hypothetical protein
MEFEHKGGGAPKREPTPSEAKRPEKNQPTLEVGEGRGGVPPPTGERQPEPAQVQPPVESAEARQIFPPPIEAVSQELTPAGNQVRGDTWREVTIETVHKAAEEIRKALGMTEAGKERQRKPTRNRKPKPPDVVRHYRPLHL